MPDRTLPTAGRAPASLPSLRVRLLGGFQVLSVNGVTVPALSSPTGVGEYDGDNVADMMGKFDRQAMVSALGSTTGDVTMVVSGQLTDGRRFVGSDTVTVIQRQNKRYVKRGRARERPHNIQVGVCPYPRLHILYLAAEPKIDVWQKTERRCRSFDLG